VVFLRQVTVPSPLRKQREAAHARSAKRRVKTRQNGDGHFGIAQDGVKKPGQRHQVYAPKVANHWQQAVETCHTVMAQMKRAGFADRPGHNSTQLNFYRKNHHEDNQQESHHRTDREGRNDHPDDDYPDYPMIAP
jgi:hypothetical protein